MKARNYRHILILGVLAVVAVVATAKVVDNTSENREKARYYYLEGALRQAGGDESGAYEYFKRASRLDPEYAVAKSSYAVSRLMNQMDTLQTSTEIDRTVGMMREFVDKYPGEFYESQYYAYVASRTGNTDEAIRVFELTDSLHPEKTSTLIHLSEAYMGIGEADKALNALRRFEKVEGPSPQLALRKVSIRLMQRDSIGAMAEIDTLILSNREEPLYLMLKGNIFEAISQPDSAEYYFKVAERLAPDNGTIKLHLANLSKQRGDSVGYDTKIYEALLSEDFGKEDKIGLLADYLQKLFADKSSTSRGDYLFKVLRDQYPHEPEVLDLAARYSAAKGDMKDAIENISYAVDLSPENEGYWSQLMSYQAADEQYAAAMNTYHRASQHIETSDNQRILYANAASFGGDVEEAVNTYSEMIHELLPDADITGKLEDKSLRNDLDYESLVKLCSLFTMLGDTYYNNHDTEAAFNAYDNALFFVSDNPLTLNNYAYFLAESGGDLSRAEEMSRSAIIRQPENETYLDTYAWVKFKQNEYKEAKEYQQKAIEKAEENDTASAELYEHYGDILFMNGAPFEALTYWTKALELDPDNVLLQKKVKNKTFFYE